MKRIIFLLIIIICLQNVYCQEIALKEYYPNGQIRMQYPMVNNKYEGVCKMWFPDGKLHISSTFENGRLHGHSTTWYPNGKIQIESDFENGFQNSVILRDTLGKVILKQNISDSRSRKQMWTSNGLKILDEKYKNGIPVICSTISNMSEFENSQTYCYYKNQLVEVTDGAYIDSTGKIIDQNYKGFLKTWYETGVKKSKNRYKSGKLHGKAMEWNAKGEIIRKEIYYQGNLTMKII